MAERPKVISAIATLFVRSGIEVALVSVEAWETETVVRLAGLPNDPTAEDQRFHDSLDDWARDGRHGPPPEEPGTRVLDVHVALGDDLGTSYILRSAQRGGTGSLFRGDWFFPTEIPSEASHLTVTASTHDGEVLGSLSLDV